MSTGVSDQVKKNSWNMPVFLLRALLGQISWYLCALSFCFRCNNFFSFFFMCYLWRNSGWKDKETKVNIKFYCHNTCFLAWISPPSFIEISICQYSIILMIWCIYLFLSSHVYFIDFRSGFNAFKNLINKIDFIRIFFISRSSVYCS